MKRCFSFGKKKKEPQLQYNNLFSEDAISRISYAFPKKIEPEEFKKMKISDKLEVIKGILRDKEQVCEIKAQGFVRQLDFTPEAARDLELLLSMPELQCDSLNTISSIYLERFVNKIRTSKIYKKYDEILSNNFKDLASKAWISKNEKNCPNSKEFEGIGYLGGEFDFYLFVKNLQMAHRFVKRGKRMKKDYLPRVGLTILLWSKIKRDFSDHPYKDALDDMIHDFRRYAKKYGVS